MFNITLALELLDMTDQAYLATPTFISRLTGTGSAVTLKGARMRSENTKRFNGRNGNSDTEGFTSISEDGDIVVAFRGSEVGFTNKDGSLRDWALTDFRSNRMEYPLNPGHWPDRNWVHTGFWLGYNAVRGKMLSQVTDLLKLNRNPQGRIFVTGFSLGGALAVLASLDLADLGPKVVLYSFAGPRAGDGTFNKFVQTKVAQSYSVVVGADPVPHLPPLGPNFPLTWHDIDIVEIGPINVPIARIPQIGQEYRTLDDIIYVNKDNQLRHELPWGEVALGFAAHSPFAYFKALSALPTWETAPDPKPGPKISVEDLPLERASQH